MDLEVEMGKMRDFYDGAMNASRRVKELEVLVTQLSAEVKASSAKINEVTSDASFLRDELARVRIERNAWESDHRVAQNENARVSHENDALQNENENLKQANLRQYDQLASIRRESDDWQLKALGYEETISDLRGRMEEFGAIAGKMLGLTRNMPELEAKPQEPEGPKGVEQIGPAASEVKPTPQEDFWNTVGRGNTG